MAESALMEVEMASLNWQENMNQNQQITAVTVNQAASLLMNLYQYAEQALDWLMGNSATNPNGGIPPIIMITTIRVRWLSQPILVIRINSIQTTLTSGKHSITKRTRIGRMSKMR